MTRPTPGSGGQRRRYVRVGIVLLLSIGLVLAISVPAAAEYDPDDIDAVPAANQPFPQQCGADVNILIDRTQSVGNDGLTDVKNATNSTVDTLNESSAVSSVGVVSFAQGEGEGAQTQVGLTRLDSEANVTSVKQGVGGIDLAEDETQTNWEAAFIESSAGGNDDDGDVANEDRSRPADVVVIISDGDPNAWGYPTVQGGFDSQQALENGTKAANFVKNESTRVIGIGIPAGSGDAPNEMSFRNVTNGSASVSDDASGDPQEIDYYTLDTAGDVDGALQGIATEFDCGAEIAKRNDADEDGNFTDAETASAPGENVTYEVEIDNTGSVDLTATAFSDDQYAGLTDEDLSCDTASGGLIGQVVPAGRTVTCTFVGTAPVEDNSSKVNTFDVTLEDEAGVTIDLSDDSTVRSPDVPPEIDVDKQVDANDDPAFEDTEQAPQPGDAVTYRVTVTNVGTDSVSLDSYDDDTYDPSVSLGGSLAPGESTSVTFDGTAPVDDNDSKTNEFTVTASDDDGNAVSDNDTATVTTPDLPPGLTVTKAVDADGDGSFADTEQAAVDQSSPYTYRITLTNDGQDDVTIDSLEDNVTDLSGTQCEAAVNGSTLAPTESIQCTFDGDTSLADDNAELVNEFTATGSDDDGTTVSDSDTATVTTPDLDPGLTVSKQVDADGNGTFANVETADAPGDAVTYRVTVVNPGNDTVTVDGFSDDTYTSLAVGDLNQSLVGESIAPGGSVVVEFDGSAPAEDNASKTNVFTVNASDDDGNDVTDSDDATVQVDDVPPTISVEKLVDADDDSTFSNVESASRGEDVTYQVTVTNVGDDTVTLDSFDDDTYSLVTANLSQPLAGESLDPGDSRVVTFTGSAPAEDNASKTNRFTVDASDDDGNQVSDNDTATVEVADIPPTISVEKLVDADGDGNYSNAETAAAPGDTVTYQVTVTNVGDESVTLDSYTDDRYDPSVSLSGSLAPGESDTVSFDGTAPAEDGSKTNTFTVAASDDDGNDVTDSDTATVDSPDFTPSIDVEKLVDADGDGAYADSEEATEINGSVTYRVTITNDGPNDVTVDAYSDDRYSPSFGSLVGTTLAPGENVTVSFDGTASTEGDTAKTNTFTVDASDGDGDTATDDDTATVTTPPAVHVCPRTPGFWSTHNEEPRGNNQNLVDDRLPVWLGTSDLAQSVRVDNENATTQEVFDYELTDDSHQSNGISKLHVHLLAAKLNEENGARTPEEVSDAIARSDEILAEYNESDWHSIKKDDKALKEEIEDLKDTLDAYNNREYAQADCVEDFWKDEEQ